MARPEISDNAVDAGSELTRGHKKKARTRQQLIGAALRIYARSGVGELALNALAEEAGVSNGTVYNYFRTREEVLDAVGIALADQLSEQILVLSEGVLGGAERLAIGVRTFILKAREDREWASALISVVRYADGMRSALAAYVRRDMRAGFAQGQFSYLNEDVAMTLVVSASMGAMAAVVEGQTVAQHDALVAEMILLALGVAPLEARHIATLPIPQLESVGEQLSVPARRRSTAGVATSSKRSGT